MDDEKEHPIRVVARRTGLSPHVIRKWEERYEAIRPYRSSGNQRLYSDVDIERLQMLNRLVKGGRSISRIAQLPREKLMRYIETDLTNGDGRKNISPPSLIEAGATAKLESFLADCISAIRRLDPQDLRDCIDKALIALGQNIVIDELFVGLLRYVGDCWQEGTMRIVHEHMATSVIRTYAGRILEMIEVPKSSPCAVAATPFEQVHELGALFGAVVCASEGWCVTYVGPNTPIEEIAAPAEQRNAGMVILSIVTPIDELRFKADMKSLRKYLDPDTKIVLGGPGINGYEDFLKELGIITVADYSSLREIARVLMQHNA